MRWNSSPYSVANPVRPLVFGHCVAEVVGVRIYQETGDQVRSHLLRGNHKGAVLPLTVSKSLANWASYMRAFAGDTQRLE